MLRMQIVSQPISNKVNKHDFDTSTLSLRIEWNCAPNCWIKPFLFKHKKRRIESSKWANCMPTAQTTCPFFFSFHFFFPSSNVKNQTRETQLHDSHNQNPEATPPLSSNKRTDIGMMITIHMKRIPPNFCSIIGQPKNLCAIATASKRVAFMANEPHLQVHISHYNCIKSLCAPKKRFLLLSFSWATLKIPLDEKNSNIFKSKKNKSCYNLPQFINFFTSSYKTNMAAAPVLLNTFERAPR